MAEIQRFPEVQVKVARLALGTACGAWLKLVGCEEDVDGEVQETCWGRT